MPPKVKGGNESTAKQLARQSSPVDILGFDGKVRKNFEVWCNDTVSTNNDPELLFAKCAVISATETKCTLQQIDPKGDGGTFEVDRKTVWNTNTQNPMDLNDIGQLEHQNTAAVLSFLKERFLKDSIYTTADPLLVAINPFRDLGITTDAIITKYREESDPSKLSPHSFTVARKALENLHNYNKSQTVIVTGESGAGKTEATKHCMRFFASGKGGTDSKIQNAVMAANPVLEAFGNAKTLRNNNSSRFGRFMQLIVAKSGGILNGFVQGFLLEKVRIVSQEKEERSYHIFYQFLKGADSSMKSKYHLREPSFYRNLTAQSGGCFEAPGIDDIEEWNEVVKSFRSMQLTQEDMDSVFSLISGVLLLGNVEFEGQTLEGQDNAACFASGSEDVLREACELLFLDDYDKVATGLQTTLKFMGKEEVTTRVKADEARQLCASLGKSVYEKLFVWIIRKLNKTIQPAGDFGSFLGILDIFGFEIFQNNSLEQLLINITNEFLQKNFTDIVFEKESALYRNEGVSTAELEFTNNKEVIEALIGKTNSVFATLEDACVAKGGTEDAFLSALTRNLSASPCFKMATGGSQKDLKFIIKHTIAEIEYSAVGFISKNMDLLKAELTEVVQASPNSVMSEMFADVKIERGKLPKGQLIASQFKTQLDSMMNLIMTTEPHFIRCVKPNDTKRPGDWNNLKVVNQLFSLSILEALQLKKLGFSWRRPFRDFVHQFRDISNSVDNRIMALSESDPQCRNLAQEMISAITNMFDNKDQFREGKEWQLGKTMVFLKVEVVREIQLLQRKALEKWKGPVQLIEAVYFRYNRICRILNVIHYLLRIQALSRSFLSLQGMETSAGAAGFPLNDPALSKKYKEMKILRREEAVHGQSWSGSTVASFSDISSDDWRWVNGDTEDTEDNKNKNNNSFPSPDRILELKIIYNDLRKGRSSFETILSSSSSSEDDECIIEDDGSEDCLSYDLQIRTASEEDLTDIDDQLGQDTTTAQTQTQTQDQIEIEVENGVVVSENELKMNFSHSKEHHGHHKIKNGQRASIEGGRTKDKNKEEKERYRILQSHYSSPSFEYLVQKMTEASSPPNSFYYQDPLRRCCVGATVKMKTVSAYQLEGKPPTIRPKYSAVDRHMLECRVLTDKRDGLSLVRMTTRQLATLCNRPSSYAGAPNMRTIKRRPEENQNIFRREIKSYSSEISIPVADRIKCIERGDFFSASLK